MTADATSHTGQLFRDIAAWVDREVADGEGVPDFWDDLCTSERLADYLTELGYEKKSMTPSPHAANFARAVNFGTKT